MTEAVDDLRRRHALAPVDEVVAEQLVAWYLRQQEAGAARSVLQTCLASRAEAGLEVEPSLLTRLVSLPAVPPSAWRRLGGWSLDALAGSL